MLLKTKSLSKSFARGKNSFFAVKDVDFSISASDFVFIVGRSGSGKTTFLNLISGILDPTQGQVFFEDQDISSMNDTDKSFYRNESIGSFKERDAPKFIRRRNKADVDCKGSYEFS